MKHGSFGSAIRQTTLRAAVEVGESNLESLKRGAESARTFTAENN